MKLPNEIEDFYRDIEIQIYKGIELVVSSSPFGCCEKGYSEIYIRRKDKKTPYKWHFPIPDDYSGCRPNAEIKVLKREIKTMLKNMKIISK